jgi:hypothetical protein
MQRRHPHSRGARVDRDASLSLKLEVFRYWWDKERNSDAPASVDPPLNGGDVMDVAAGIVLDILKMIRRDDGGVAEIGKAA